MRSDAFLVRQPYLRHAICERVAAGERLKAICAEPGAPSTAAIRVWRRQDAAFDAALAAAQSAAAQRRYFPFDEAKAAEIVRRLEAGEALGAIVADPAMPSWRCVRHWRRVQGHFAEAVWLALRRRRAFIQALCHPPRKDWDPAVAEAVLLAVAKGTPVKRLASLGLPGKRVIARWRLQHPGFDAELRTLARIGVGVRSRLRERAAAEAVAERVAAGASLRAVGAEPGMPHARTLGNWTRRGGALAAALREARAIRADALADEALDVAEGPGEAAAKTRAAQRLMRASDRLGARAKAPD